MKWYQMIWIICWCYLIPACGGDKQKSDKPLPADIKALVQTYCSRCHDNDGIVYQAADRLRNKSMPQLASIEAKNLSDIDRSKLISFAEAPQSGEHDGGGYSAGLQNLNHPEISR